MERKDFPSGRRRVRRGHAELNGEFAELAEDHAPFSSANSVLRELRVPGTSVERETASVGRLSFAGENHENERRTKMPVSEDLIRRLTTAVAEAKRVGDSPVAADRLAATVAALAKDVAAADATDETRSRMGAALADAERVLRRDDDGREAARHLESALTVARRVAPTKEWPF